MPSQTVHSPTMVTTKTITAGSRIVVTRDDFINPTQIDVMDSDGSNVVKISDGATFDFEADWGRSRHHDDD